MPKIKDVPAARAASDPHFALFAILERRREELGQTVREMALDMGVDVPTLYALRAGRRRIEHAGREVYVGAARYLGVPVIHVFLMSGLIVSEDFVLRPTLRQKAQSMLDAIAADPLWSGFAPNRKTWDALDIKTQILVGMLFERATGTEVFSGSLVSFVESMSSDAPAPAAKPAGRAVRRSSRN